MCRSVKFIVILLIMHVGVIFNCCVKPVRLHKCTAGAACAKNPYHCKECHKDTWAKLAEADQNPNDTNDVEDKSEEDMQTTTELDDFIDNEIPRKAIDTGSSSEDIHIPRKTVSKIDTDSSEDIHIAVRKGSSKTDARISSKIEARTFPKIDAQTFSKIDARTPTVPLMFLNASYTIMTETRHRDNEETTEPIMDTSITEEIEFTQEKSVREQMLTLEEQMAAQEQVTRKTTAEPKRQHYQRGVLDMLVPHARVQAFKRYFEAFRRFLSHTF